jgi:hypothetical protein
MFTKRFRDRSDWPLTRLILELGGNAEFQTFCQWNEEESRLQFGEGNQPGKAARLLKKELRKMKFDPNKTIQIENVRMLIQILENEVS